MDGCRIEGASLTKPFLCQGKGCVEDGGAGAGGKAERRSTYK